LNAPQRRVLGVLIEKAKTTPAGYPMSLNAIVAGCNQKSNREPVTELEDGEVERALDELTAMGVASEAPLVSRVPKYRHHAYQWMGVNRAELAVIGELLLRGAQTLGDLRARAARMEPIADQAALKPIVEGLVQRGLMIELGPPGRGQVVSHNLYLQPELDALRSRSLGRDHASARSDSSRSRDFDPEERPTSFRSGAHGGEAEGRWAELSAGLAELREEVSRLRDQVRDLETRLDERR